MKPYLVKCIVTEQVGPDDWESVSKEKLFDESTTLKEVREWAVLNGRCRRAGNGTKIMSEVSLSEPQQ